MRECLAIGLFVLAAVVGGVAYALSPLYTRTSITLTVAHKDPPSCTANSSGGTDCRYFISTQEGETFQDSDARYFLKFDSGKLYLQLQEGHAYRVTVAGWSFPLFGWYRNIVSIDGPASARITSRDSGSF